MATTTTEVTAAKANGHLPTRRRLRQVERGKATGPMQSMIAAASVLTRRTIRRNTHEGWQDEAWDFYDEIGELRFVANAVAGAMSHARLYVGQLDDSDRDDPEEVTDGEPVEIFKLLGGGPAGKAELIRRMGIQLFVPGDGWILGLPHGTLEDEDKVDDPAARIGPDGDDEGGLKLADLSWHVFSVTEVTFRSGEVEINLGNGEKRTLSEERCYPIRVWRAHPRRWWTADSPVRANLPVLRELRGLTQHVGASIDSRLAGAGMLFLPESAEIMGAIAESPDEDDDAEVDPFIATLMDAMITPIRNRDSASAVVPVLVKVSDEALANIDQGNLITFATPFDERAKDLRDEAIRRLALGLDTTPEMLLGMGSVNHWSAWLLDELNAKIHIDPVLGTICDALTTAYLRPALQEAGVQDPDRYVVWWDLSDLTLRPDRSAEATTGRTMGILSDEAWRRANGFDESDAPPAEEQGIDIAVRTALELVTAAPSLIQSPGLPALVEQIRTVTGGGAPQAALPADDPGEAQPPTDDASDAPRGTPDTQGDVPDPALPASAARRQMMPRDEDGSEL